MLSRYHMIASYSMKVVERQIRARSLRRPAAQFLRESSSSSNRPLHTTSTLHSGAAALLQNNSGEDDDDLNSFLASHMQELSVHDSSKSLDKSSLEQKNETLKHEGSFDHPFNPDNPPKTLDDWQDWLEHEAQQESVERYRKLLDSARNRDDFSSMGVVQKQILEWYQPLKDIIQEEQAIFVSSQAGQKKKKSMYVYGHYLCALAPEKLAIILAHEAVSFCLASSLRNDVGYGVTVAMLARHIGQVVETEINVHRAIEKRARENRRSSRKGSDPFLDALDDYEDDDDDDDEFDDYSSGDDIDDDDDDDDEDVGISGWNYTAHHRHLFVEEISRNGSSRSGRERLRYASQKARAIVDTDEWTIAQQVQLGVALVDVLIRGANVPGLHGRPEKAFSHHVAWKKTKFVGWVLIHEIFVKQVMEDAFEVRSDFWARHSPMVVPPKPWASPSEGAYKSLKVEVMRTHGSRVQRVSCTKLGVEVARFLVNLTHYAKRRRC